MTITCRSHDLACRSHDPASRSLTESSILLLSELRSSRAGSQFCIRISLASLPHIASTACRWSAGAWGWERGGGQVKEAGREGRQGVETGSGGRREALLTILLQTQGRGMYQSCTYTLLVGRHLICQSLTSSLNPAHVMPHLMPRPLTTAL